MDARTPSMFDDVLEESSQSSHEFSSTSEENGNETSKKSKVQFGKTIKKKLKGEKSSQRASEREPENPLALKR